MDTARDGEANSRKDVHIRHAGVLTVRVLEKQKNSTTGGYLFEIGRLYIVEGENPASCRACRSGW